MKRHAKEGVKEGDGLKLFKIRKVRVPTEEDGRAFIRTELMVIVQCKKSDAHHAIYRDLNQTVATKLRIGVYTFHTRGCKYPDRTLCSLSIDIQQIRDRLRIKTSIMDQVYIDVKENRSSQEDRPHINKVRGGYPVERVMGIAVLPTYNPTTKTQHSLSTPSRPSGQLLEERDKEANAVTIETRIHNQTVRKLPDHEPQIKAQQSIPSTPDRPPGPLLEGKNRENKLMVTKYQPSNQRQKRSSTSEEGASVITSGRRFVISDVFYNRTPVSERLCLKRIKPTTPALEDHYFGPQLDNQKDSLSVLTQHMSKVRELREEDRQRQTNQPQFTNIGQKTSSIKTVKTLVIPNVQTITTPPKVPYSAVVKSTPSMEPTNSTLKSTSDV